MTPAGKLHQSVYSAADFVERDIKARPWMVEKCIPHPSLGMLYAWRGSAKTYTSLSLSLALATGQPWFDYPVNGRHGVLYIDGEMPLGDLKTRLVDLTDGHPPENLFILASEDLAVKGYDLNLARPSCRNDITQLLVDLDKRGTPVDMVILDNWVSLVTVQDANNESEINDIKKWMIMLRHGEKSVIIVHHAGKTGEQRGTSAREDNLDYSISLRQTGSRNGESTFSLWWDKSRGARPEPDTIEFKIFTANNGRVKIERIKPNQR